MTHYFETVPLLPEELAKRKIKAETQAAKIAEFFASDNLTWEHRASPSYVHNRLRVELNGAPLTSVRRSMTVLTDKGVLRKTSDKVDGPYGHPEHLWELDPTFKATIQSKQL